MTGFKINKQAINKLQRELNREFERAAKKNPIRIPVEVESADLSTSLPSAWSGIENDPFLARLVLWLDEQEKVQPGVLIDVTQFTENEPLSEADAHRLALRLDGLGLVIFSRSMAGNDTQVILNDEGHVEADRLRVLGRDSTARFRHACDAVLHWLFENRSGGPLEVVAFIDTPGVYFAGSALKVDEIIGALEFLAERGLVLSARAAGTPNASIRAKVSDLGTDCVISGGTVGEFLTRQQTKGDSYTISNSTGFVAGSQAQVTQTNHFGLDVSAAKEFAALVRQFAPTLGASAAEEAELVQYARVLDETTSEDEPEPGKVRAALESVRGKLGTITATTAGLTLLVQKGFEAYKMLSGG